MPLRIKAIGESEPKLKPRRGIADACCMSASQPEATEPLDVEPAELPYTITPHISVSQLPEGGMEFRFGRSLHPGLTSLLVIASLAGFFLTSLLSLVRMPSGLLWIVGTTTVLGVSAVFLSSTSWRNTRVVAKPGSLWYCTRFLPGLGYEQTIQREEIESIRRHSRNFRGTTVYQLRAHLRGRKIVSIGHGISDKVEAASLASAIERSLGVA